MQPQDTFCSSTFSGNADLRGKGLNNYWHAGQGLRVNNGDSGEAQISRALCECLYVPP